MNVNHLQFFVCPECKATLHLDSISQRTSEDVVSGIIACKVGHSFNITNGIPRLLPKSIEKNKQETQVSFSMKWKTEGVNKYGLDGPIAAFHHEWYLKRYGWESEQEFEDFLGSHELILDAGCGVGRDVKWFAQNTKGVVFGIDISESIDEAKENLKCFPNVVLVQGDITKLPFPKGFFDFVSCDQVIHHTPDTEQTFRHLVEHVREEGTFSTYTYKVKGPIREFADDFIRKHATNMTYEECHELSRQLTLLGKALSELNATVDVPEDIPLLKIKKGKIDVQRFIYWNMMKCFWNEEHGMQASIMTNFDWYHPKDAHRHRPEELERWMSQCGLRKVHFDIGDAGVSVRAIR